MPTKIEKDSVTGTETTGHEWDGIKELNSPLPRWWLYVMYACIVWSVAYWFIFPAIPWIDGYTRGLLGYNQRDALEQQLAAARERQAVLRDGIDKASLQEIRNDAQLLQFAVAGGGIAFADNCAGCHGLGGAGQRGGYPSLADDAWIWGGTLDAIHTTLQHGIRWDDADTRWSEMPGFGELGILTEAEISDVADYALSLSGSAGNAAAIARGAEVFEFQCAACHGDQGTGMEDVGAPNLADRIWLYGGEREQIVAQIAQPEHGVMPGWSGRLDPAAIKMLTVYVHTLGGGQ
ncbi:MAG: cytochrome-c oxidase, cbb3-type subunit III [Inquilinus sp.]|nr:cytochrome-c oxidase, cbb3-type subunit III [Inquilinus sp.]